VTTIEAIKAVVDERLKGRTAVFEDNLENCNCVKILWGDYYGRVAWSEDEREYQSEYWLDCIKLRTWEVTSEMLALKERTEEAAEAVK
jgi:hypothetical protein